MNGTETLRQGTLVILLSSVTEANSKLNPIPKNLVK